VAGALKTHVNLYHLCSKFVFFLFICHSYRDGLNFKKKPVNPPSTSIQGYKAVLEAEKKCQVLDTDLEQYLVKIG
jgi:hypothetical protein